MMVEWTKLREGPLRAGFRALVRRTFRLPDGTVADFDIKQEGPCVCVLALTAHNTVILARQFRPGPETILAELPGGAVDVGETPEDAMRRELIEETGYTGGGGRLPAPHRRPRASGPSHPLPLSGSHITAQ